MTTARAVEAAAAVAAVHGIVSDDPVVISSGSNVLVHLRPAPVVARVMTGTIALHGDPRRWLEREVSVLEFLSGTDLAVAPSRLLPPGPHRQDGLWMTFTEWIADVAPAPERGATVDLDTARRFGTALRQLHDALRPFAGDLAGMDDLRGDIERLLAQIEPADRDEHGAVAAAAERLASLGPTVFAVELATQALHGDVSLRNLLEAPGDVSARRGVSVPGDVSARRGVSVPRHVPTPLRAPTPTRVRTSQHSGRPDPACLPGAHPGPEVPASPGRLVWNDFEDVFRGPVHWDLASAVGSLRTHGADGDAVAQALAAYGWDDGPALAPFLAAQEVYDEIWRMYDRQRRRGRAHGATDR